MFHGSWRSNLNVEDVDPDFAAGLDEYYALLAKEHELSPAKRTRLDALSWKMTRIRLVGDTPREQILLRTIDEYLARADAASQPIDRPGGTAR